MTDREPSDLGTGDRRRYYQMGLEDGLQQAKEMLTNEELLQEVGMRGLDHYRPLDEEKLKKVEADAFKAGEASRMDWAVAFATEKALRDIHRANLEAERNTTKAREAARRKAEEDLEAASMPPQGYLQEEALGTVGEPRKWWEFWK